MFATGWDGNEIVIVPFRPVPSENVLPVQSPADNYLCFYTGAASVLQTFIIWMKGKFYLFLRGDKISLKEVL